MCKRVHFIAVASCCAAVFALSAAVSAQEKTDFDSATIFKSMCAPCHGVAGDGDGPVAGALKMKPKPLSGLTSRYGGKFPASYVYETIDGRVEVTAHGNRDMPVWGTWFGQKFNTLGAEATAKDIEDNNRQIISAIVDYVGTMQSKP